MRSSPGSASGSEDRFTWNIALPCPDQLDCCWASSPTNELGICSTLTQQRVRALLHVATPGLEPLLG